MTHQQRQAMTCRSRLEDDDSSTGTERWCFVGMAMGKDTEAGWIVELDPGCWMVSATADPDRTLKQ